VGRSGIIMQANQEEAMTSIERVGTVLDLKEPDRVPIWVLMDWLPAKYYDITVEELVFNPVKAQKANEWIFNKVGGFDLGIAGGAMYPIHINPFPIIYSSYYLDWKLPGRQLSKNTSPQLAERSTTNPIITVEDYDSIITDGFLKFFNFRNASMLDLMKLNKKVDHIAKNTKRWLEVYKVPPLTDSGAFLPFEVLSYLRGSTNFMKDTYRCPEKIREVSDFMIDGMIALSEYAASLTGGNTILMGNIRSSGDFISLKTFEELVWPYFKKMVTKFLEDGYVVQLHNDTNWTDRLHYLTELPKGKIYMHMDERTDIKKAKEILGDHMAIEGNFKPSLFTLGTPNQIEKRTKEIIDDCAEGGGLWVGVEIPDDAKLENLKALCDTCKTYGAYRK
jgi:hypothetical protein